jgi:hypothetical protein
MKANLLHFIRLQFLNGHILVPHKTRRLCSVVMSVKKDGAGSACNLGTVGVTYRTAVQKANAHQHLHVC